jgi:hypothetical protein
MRANQTIDAVDSFDGPDCTQLKWECKIVTKTLEVRQVITRLAAIHTRLGAVDGPKALRDLATLLQPYDDKTIATFLTKAKGSAKKRRPKPKG